MPDGLTRSGGPILLTTDAVGGVWRYTLDLARALPTPPLIAILGPAPSVAQRAEAAGFRLIDTDLALDWTAKDSAELAATVASLRALAIAERARSVHLHAPALAGSERWPIPVVAVAHSCVATWWAAVHDGPLPPDLAWRAAATATGLRTATATIAPTYAHATATRRAYGNLDLHVIHNGLPTQPQSSAPGLTRGSTARPELPCTSASTPLVEPKGGTLDRRVEPGDDDEAAPIPAILTAGRLWDAAKNAVALDRVAATLPIHAAGPTTGPNGASIHLPNLHHLGTLDTAGMARAYAGATVFASLARYEPFGLAVLEAARAGLRLVLSDIPSFRELWDGVARFVPLDADPAPALRAALADPGDGGAAERAASYTVERMARATLTLHDKVAA